VEDEFLLIAIEKYAIIKQYIEKQGEKNDDMSALPYRTDRRTGKETILYIVFVQKIL
jgi:hypothetical protein